MQDDIFTFSFSITLFRGVMHHCIAFCIFVILYIL